MRRLEEKAILKGMLPLLIKLSRDSEMYDKDSRDAVVLYFCFCFKWCGYLFLTCLFIQIGEGRYNRKLWYYHGNSH